MYNDNLLNEANKMVEHARKMTFKSTINENKELIVEESLDEELKDGRQYFVYKKVKWPIEIKADIEARGGVKGKGTRVSVFVIDSNGKKTARGFQGPASNKKITDLIKRQVDKGDKPNMDAKDVKESKELEEGISKKEIEKAIKEVEKGKAKSQVAQSLQTYKDRKEFDGSLKSAIKCLKQAEYEISESEELKEGVSWMDDEGKSTKPVKKGQKVVALQNFTSKEVADKDFLDLEDVDIKKGSKGKVVYIGSQGEVHIDWGKKKVTTDMFNAEFTDDVSLNESEELEEAKEQIRTHIPKGFVAYTGVKWADQQVKAYNDYQDKINQYVKAGKKIPEELLNGSHNLFVSISKKTLKDSMEEKEMVESKFLKQPVEKKSLTEEQVLNEASISFELDGLKEIDTTAGGSGKNNVLELSKKLTMKASTMLQSMFFNSLLSISDVGGKVKDKVTLKLNLDYNKKKGVIRVNLSENEKTYKNELIEEKGTGESLLDELYEAELGEAGEIDSKVKKVKKYIEKELKTSKNPSRHMALKVISGIATKKYNSNIVNLALAELKREGVISASDVIGKKNESELEEGKDGIVFNGKNTKEIASFLSKKGFKLNQEPNGKISVDINGKDTVIFKDDVLSFKGKKLVVKKPSYVVKESKFLKEAKAYDLKVVVDATGENLLFVFQDFTGNAKSILSKYSVGTENGVVYTNAQKKGSKEELLKAFELVSKKAKKSFAVSLPKNATDRVAMIRSSADELGKKTKIKGLLKEEVDIKKIISDLINNSWSGSNESQLKSVQLTKGLAFSDEPAANKFMKKLDSITSGMDAKKYEGGGKATEAIKELISTSFGGSNESQAKAVQLMIGISTSDEDVSNSFMADLDKETSNLKPEEFTESQEIKSPFLLS